MPREIKLVCNITKKEFAYKILEWEEKEKLFPKLAQVSFDFGFEFINNCGEDEWENCSHEKLVELTSDFKRKYKLELLEYLKNYGVRSGYMEYFCEEIISVDSDETAIGIYDMTSNTIDSSEVPLFVINDFVDSTRNIKLWTYDEVEKYFENF